MTKATAANIALFLNRTLRIRKIKDASVNGLQVKSGKRGELRKIGFAVDACLSTFDKADKLNVDFLVVHHGIKWRPRKDRQLEALRMARLKTYDMALYAAHLPIDLHEEYGNNIQLCRMLEVLKPRRFGRYHGIKIGYAGKFVRPMGLETLAGKLERGLGASCRMFRFGKDRVRSIGVVSGGGGSLLQDAVGERLDCFLVGEIDLAVHNAAKEHGMNLLVAGHYATETVGVKALMPLIKDRFSVETVFVSDPKEL